VRAAASTATTDVRADDGRTGARDRGSVLMLVPAGLLVVLVMASIAVDMSLVQLRQRQAHDLAAGAANDAATAAIDSGSVRSHTVVIDVDAAARIAEEVVAASDLSADVVGRPAVRVVDGRVEVEVSLRADYIFAGVVPGADDGMTVTATASAQSARP
jgi:hypothetical protein